MDRRGYVQWVMVGNPHRLFLPDLGRMRGGRARFRGLRLLHTHLRKETLTRDDLADLTLLRLDYVAAITVEEGGLPGRIFGAHLLPGADGPEPYRLETFDSPRETGEDFLARITALEEEFARKLSVQRVEGDRGKAVCVVWAERSHEAEETLAELRELCRTAGVAVVGAESQVRPRPDPRWLVGKGKLEEIVTSAMQRGADLLVMGSDLQPAQAKAIANFTDLKVIDRTQLILDIFARRAHSRDGKLQVELAQLRYRLPRLVHEDTGLSRLAGGIGGQGPGETKLEIDRRRARERIRRLEKEIERLSARRGIKRGLRERANLPVVAIVGYTNAGKSTLHNAMTQSRVLVEDKLFATLDPTSRRLRFPQEREVILVDTVGFIRDLPPELARAFRATLEELDYADLLLHILDASDHRLFEQKEAVEKILAELELLSVPRLVLLNKCDRIPPEQATALAERTGAVPISALRKTNFDEVLRRAEALLFPAGASRDASR